ncbi:Metallo-hydrolase/oxidoreductase [Polychaeton citri CBS 116435]|uniref:Metallo-hydrolase/oxidoreductase n=1 Tax=Polychaeton citri CBS 116435 TaxID=1314669 RepID=A0A9P4QF98_9PEZI|nr:Metallo-hydrolase/oxidoreductase [Polychaeton citri CBS 116435]
MPNAIQAQIDNGAIASYVSNVCPTGTKMWVLEVGWLECDEGFVVRGGNTSLKSTEGESFQNKRRQMPMYCILIEHPHEGCILWETGSGRDYPTVWGPQVSDVFSRVRYEPRHELDAAIEATGHKLEDIKKIIIGHLHLDHAGGLDLFLDRKDVEIWVHDLELRSAFWSVATGADVGVYLKHYLRLDLNWKTFDERTLDFCQGITLHHLPGHTDGLVGMQINLHNSGTFLFISDHCHVIENWRDGIPQGWLARDHPAWFRSTQRLKQIERQTRGRVIPGHDEETFMQIKGEKEVYT